MKGASNKALSNSTLSNSKDPSKTKPPSQGKSTLKNVKSNIFRQMNANIKTSKNSPEKNCNFSGKRIKVLIKAHNNINNSISANSNLNINKETNINSISTSKQFLNCNNVSVHEKIDCLNEIDFLKKKLLKKMERCKANISLNNTSSKRMMNSSIQSKRNLINDYNLKKKYEFKESDKSFNRLDKLSQKANHDIKRFGNSIIEGNDEESLKSVKDVKHVDNKTTTSKFPHRKKLNSMDNLRNDFKKQLDLSISNQFIKNDLLRIKKTILNSQKSTNFQMKTNKKEVQNKDIKDPIKNLKKETSRKASLERNNKNNSSMILEGSINMISLKQTNKSIHNSSLTQMNASYSKSSQKNLVKIKDILKEQQVLAFLSKKPSFNKKKNPDLHSSKITAIYNNLVDSKKILDQKKQLIAINILNQNKKFSKTPRLEEKIDLIKKNIEELKKFSNDKTAIQKKNLSKIPNLIKNDFTKIDKIEIIAPKKHSTSINSPKNLLLNLKKDIIMCDSKKSEIIDKEKSPSKNTITSEKQIKDQSTLKLVTIPLEKNESVNEKDNNDVSKSLENILETSNCSIRSTLRESNYYRKEAEKLSNYIKKYYKQNYEYPPSNTKFYKYGRLLGKGAFGKVNLCLQISTGRLVAIKSFNKKNIGVNNSIKKILYETKLMKSLRHTNIVSIYDMFENSDYFMIVIEYVYGGDLLSFVRKRTKLNELMAKFIFKQLIEGLDYIHSQNIVHRDIKLDNILIDLNNNIKICDFGVSKKVKKGHMMNDQCGTPAYIAPEILKNMGYEGFSVDIWSAGVVLYTMLSGTVPFKGNNISELRDIIIKGGFQPLKELSDEANNLLSGLLEIDPNKRLTTDEILNHPWLTNDSEKLETKTNLFTIAEQVLLFKSNIDFRYANKEELIENFTLKNLDSLQDLECQNINTKSFILAPFNTSYKFYEKYITDDVHIENEVIKVIGKAKDANREYELNNNGEIDNGILINNPQNEKESPFNNSKDNISKPVSPLFDSPERKRSSSRPSPKESFKNLNQTEILDDSIVQKIEEIGYTRDYLINSLLKNELNYAVGTYFLLKNSKINLTN